MRNANAFNDENGDLTLVVFASSPSSQDEIYKGEEAYYRLSDIFSKEVDFSYNVNKSSVLVKTKDCVIQLDNVNYADKDDYLTSLIDAINYQQKEKARKEQKQEEKVVRDNKYNGKKMLLTGIVAFFVATGSVGLNSLASKSKGKSEYTTARVGDTIVLEARDKDMTVPPFSTEEPTKEPSTLETLPPTSTPTPTMEPTSTPTVTPTLEPTIEPTVQPSTQAPTFNDNSYSDNSYDVVIPREDLTETKKALTAMELYHDVIRENALKYGLSEELVMAVAIQERGIHSNVMDHGGSTGLMQIHKQWIGKSVTAHNFVTGQEETVTITEDNITDLYTNVRIGCMGLQRSMHEMNYNILLGVQTNNFGADNMEKVLKYYANETGKTLEEIYSDQSDIGWLPYCNIIKEEGDKEYLNHVFAYIPNGSNIYILKPDGTKISLNVIEEKKINNK